VVGLRSLTSHSVSFQPYVDWPQQERWDLVAQGLGEAAQRLETAGADFIVMATNTMHLVFEEVQARVQVPMLSLLDAVGEAILAGGMRRVGLLGTQYTMEKTFYHDALGRRGITVLTGKVSPTVRPVLREPPALLLSLSRDSTRRAQPSIVLPGLV